MSPNGSKKSSSDSKSRKSAKKSATKSRGCNKSSKLIKSKSEKKSKINCDKSKIYRTNAPTFRLLETFPPSPFPTFDSATASPTTQPSTLAPSKSPSYQEPSTPVTTTTPSSVRPSPRPTTESSTPTLGPSSIPSSLAPIDPAIDHYRDLDVAICRCNEEAICENGPLPRGSTLRLCFSVSSHWSVDFLENLHVDQTGFVRLDVVLMGHLVHDEAELNCDLSRKECVVSTPLIDEFFATNAPADILAKGIVALLADRDSRMLRTRRNQLIVPFQIPMKLEKLSVDDTVLEKKLSSLEKVPRRRRLTYAISIAVVTGAIFLVFIIDAAVYHTAVGRGVEEWLHDW